MQKVLSQILRFPERKKFVPPLVPAANKLDNLTHEITLRFQEIM